VIRTTAHRQASDAAMEVRATVFFFLESMVFLSE
jgi:hypothetical protein